MVSHRLFITSLIFVLTGAAGANGHNYLMCKTVEDIFTSTSSTGNHNNSSKLQGPPGKRGPIGRPGLRGPIGGPGPEGIVDYQMVNDTIDAKIQKDTNQRRILARQQCVGDGGMWSRGSCFFHVISTSTYDQAKVLCRQHNAVLAEFQDMSQQTELQDALRVKIQSGSPEFWIGMKYISLGQQLEYSTGRQVSYNQFEWHSGHPSGNNKYLTVEVDKTNHNHGALINQSPGTSVDGALCERRL